MKDPAESADDFIEWWDMTGRKYFWGWVAGVWTMVLLVYAMV